jgi:hypothetical protein
MKMLRARKGYGFHAPCYKPWAYRLLKGIARPYLRYGEGVRELRVEGMEHLAQRMTAFQAGDERLLILFRHVAKEDAPVMARFLVREFPRWCRRNGIRLSSPSHAHFLYGKDVLNWAGAGARWLFPRIGGIPVVNTKVDRASQGTIRRLLVEGRFPLCFAPEGQVTYHMFRTFEPAPGTATLAGWTLKDLRARGDRRPVAIVPVALGYLPEENPAVLTKQLLLKLNGELGRRGSGEQELDAELLSAAAATAGFLETSYAREYPGIARFEEPLALQERFDRLCDTILRCGEASFGWTAQGTVLERVFRLRYRIMESLYREDVDPARLSFLERSRADFQAQVAATLKRHEETVDILEYIRQDYLDEPGILRRLEFVLNLLDVLNRARGGNIDSRYTLKKKTALISIGEPLILSDPMSRVEQKSLNGDIVRRFEQLGREMEESAFHV